MYDEDIDENHVVGETSIELSTLCISSGVDQWIVLEKDGQDTCNIHIKTSWMP